MPPWKNQRIHNFGNHGIAGLFHAIVASPVTKLIDAIAYDNIDVRGILYTDNSVDLGCGVGLSTSPGQIGVDSSNEMLKIAKYVNPSNIYYRGLAEKWGKENMTECVTISFVLHEQNSDRRTKILKNAFRITKKNILVMDIDPQYIPSSMMKTGEPYIDSYLKNIDAEILALFDKVERKSIINNRVTLWNITKTDNY